MGCVPLIFDAASDVEAEAPEAAFIKAEAVKTKLLEAEAETKAAEKVLEVEAIKIYRFHCFHYADI